MFYTRGGAWPTDAGLVLVSLIGTRLEIELLGLGRGAGGENLQAHVHLGDTAELGRYFAQQFSVKEKNEGERTKGIHPRVKGRRAELVS